MLSLIPQVWFGKLKYKPVKREKISQLKSRTAKGFVLFPAEELELLTQSFWGAAHLSKKMKLKHTAMVSAWKEVLICREKSFCISFLLTIKALFT